MEWSVCVLEVGWGRQVFSKIISRKPRIHTRILSIDGGGVRGIVAATILAHLETKLQKLSSNPEVRLVDYFDLFAGTSTGAMIVASLLSPDKNGRPKYTAAEIIKLYLKDSETIFKSSFIQGIKSASGLLDVKYNAEGIELICEQYFGAIELKQLLKPCLIPAYNLTSGNSYFFRQHLAKTDENHNYLLKDIIRATTSAPTYFPPAQIQNIKNTNKSCFVDGGIFAVNPALSAYAEFRRLNNKLSSENTLVLSLGTGKQNTVLDCEQIQHWGAVEWRDPGSNLISTALAERSHQELAAVYCDNQNYLRLNPEIDEKHSSSLDNCDSDYLKFLHNLGKKFVANNKKQLNNFAKRLLKSQKN
ncbi:MAG: patatin [Candidatus Thioglobus sp.]|nr:patatin [Candidatus Thioglobus sp.]